MERGSDRHDIDEISPTGSGMTSILTTHGPPCDVDSSPEPASRDSPSACNAAVTTDRDRIAQRLNDDVITGMFGVGLRLQATAQLADGAVQARLEIAIRDLDLIIAEVRCVIFDRTPRPEHGSDDTT
jgi:hypothetical protein